MSNDVPVYATPTVKRRLIAMLYESFLLAAVLLLAQGLIMLLTLNQHTPLFQYIQHFFVFMVTAAYFIHSWTDSGHTLAMKTWRIKVVQPGHAKLPLRTAAFRFMLAWGWFLPALLACYVLRLTTPKEVGVAVLVGVAAWALTAFLDKDRQFLHDKLAGTRLIRLPKPVKAPKPVAPAAV